MTRQRSRRVKPRASSQTDETDPPPDGWPGDDRHRPSLASPRGRPSPDPVASGPLASIVTDWHPAARGGRPERKPENPAGAGLPGAGARGRRDLRSGSPVRSDSRRDDPPGGDGPDRGTRAPDLKLSNNASWGRWLRVGGPPSATAVPRHAQSSWPASAGPPEPHAQEGSEGVPIVDARIVRGESDGGAHGQWSQPVSSNPCSVTTPSWLSLYVTSMPAASVRCLSVAKSPRNPFTWHAGAQPRRCAHGPAVGRPSGPT